MMLLFRRTTLVVILMLGALTLVGRAEAQTPLPPLPLRTQGSQIVDATGAPVILQGVNWFGLETSNHAPHGLWSRDYRDMLSQIRSLGFNTIRLPFSLQALRSSTTSGIDYSAGRNASLQGRTPLQVMDTIIAEAGAQGLMVILDNHSQADDGFMYDLWYGQSGFTEDDWVATWTDLARRYRSTPHVVGFDLKNEPHGSATWGTGGATDWRRAAERAGNAVLAVAPDKLILVEGIEGPVAGGQQLDRHWWGGNLEGVRNNPVRLSVPGRVVYSPHEYGPGVFAQPWFSDPDMAAILADRWAKGFGYILDQGIAPVLVGEFGAKNVGPDTTEGRWIRQFADYLGRTGASWTFWAWNPNSGDTGGVLRDDWNTVDTTKMGLLRALIDRAPITDPPPAGTSPTPIPTTPSPTPTPTATSTPTPTPPPPGQSPTGEVTARVATDSTWSGGWCGRLTVQNSTGARIDISRIDVTLSSDATVTSSWNGQFDRSGTRLSVATPSWATADPGRTYADTGLCVSGPAPTEPVATWRTTGTAPPAAPTTTPTPTISPTPSSPTPSPTPSQTVAPTPTQAPGISVSAAPAAAVLQGQISVTTSWQDGDCRVLTVRNTGPVAADDYTASFGLPSGTRLTSSWNGEVSRNGSMVTVRPPTWARSITPGTTRSDFGFCTARG